MKKIILLIVIISNTNADQKINLGEAFNKGLRKGLYSITHSEKVLKRGEKEEIECNKKYWKYYHESNNLYWNIKRYNEKFKKAIQKYGFKFYEMKRAIGRSVTINEQKIKKESCSKNLAHIKIINEKNIANELETNRILFMTIKNNRLKLKEKIKLLKE